MDTPLTPSIQDELNHLPQGFNHLSEEMQLLVAALRQLDLLVTRADDTKNFIQREKDDLYYYIGQPSVTLTAKNSHGLIKEHQKLIRTVEPDNEELFTITNKIIHNNLEVQRQLFQLLKVFYSDRTPLYHARLIVEGDFQDTFLKPLGSNVRPLLDKPTQQQWANDMKQEMTAFSVFLINQL